MCVYSTDQIKEIIKPIALKYGLDTVYLFGSYARNEATESSDIDLYIPSLPKRMGIRFYGMYEDIKEMTNKEIDIITDSSAFRNLSEKTALFSNLNKDKVMIYG